MSAFDKLYGIQDKTVKHTINIEDTLYEELQLIAQNKYDATISVLINIAIEDYFDKSKTIYHEKPLNESTTGRSIMIRKSNLEKLHLFQKKTGIPITKLLNSTIKEFIIECNKI